MSDQNQNTACQDCDDRDDDDSDFILAMAEIFSAASKGGPSSEAIVAPPERFLVQERAFTPPGRTTFNRQALLADLSIPQAASPSPDNRAERAKNMVIEDPVAA